MSTICVNGGSVAGLSTALVLAADGHDVTVIERDPAPPTRNPEALWDSWERRGVPQFRQTHAYHARARQVLASELPHVWTRLVEAGILEHSLAGHPPHTAADGVARAGDDELTLALGRRCIFEAVLRYAAEDDPRIEVLAGTATKGLLGSPQRVQGLTTSAGAIEADIVVDCGGRRSAVGDWVEDLGGRRPAEEGADYRIAYWTQWFRLRPGATTPELAGPPNLEIGPLEIIRLPADNGWFSITVVATAGDKRFRVLADQDRLMRFLSRFEPTREWVDPSVAVPVGSIIPMVSVVDQRRRLVVDGEPCVQGLVGVGDAVATTNPTLARGTSFALMHAVGLRDLLRADDDPTTITRRHHDLLEEDFEPWWQSTREADQAHLARMQAAVEGRDVEPDPGWMFLHAAGHDAELWRVALRVFGVLELPDQVVARPGVMERVIATIGRVGPPSIEHLDVEALLAS